MRNPFKRRPTRARTCRLCYALFPTDNAFYDHVNREHFTSLRVGIHVGQHSDCERCGG